VRVGLTQVLPLGLTLALVGGVSWYHFLFSGFTIHGAVVERGTGKALATTISRTVLGGAHARACHTRSTPANTCGCWSCAAVSRTA